MGKTKGRANGDGDVFPRKNKAGKITSYRVPTSDWTASDGTSAARPKRRRAATFAGPGAMRSAVSSSTRTTYRWESTLTAGYQTPCATR